MKHSTIKRLKEEFTGKRNILTVTLVLVGGYFIAYPIVITSIEYLGRSLTVVVGFLIVVIGDFMMDVFHKE
jgi:hypothetical protein